MPETILPTIDIPPDVVNVIRYGSYYDAPVRYALRYGDTGHRFVDQFGRIISHLSAPLPETYWMVHPFCYNEGDRWDVHVMCDDIGQRMNTTLVYGVSRYDCTMRCQWSDGCGYCNTDEWRVCPTSYCYGVEASRVPRVWPGREDTPDYCRCWQECNHCQDEFSPRGIEYLRGVDVNVCTGCRDGYYSYCDDCDEWYGDDDFHECPPPEQCDCGDCGECNADGLIRSYSYKPYPEFHGNGPLYLGLECEVNTGSNSIREVAEFVSSRLGGLAYLKSDSSIRGGGFEIVTHPMSYEYALESFPWDMWFELRNRFNMRNTTDCGIHVHISRAGFSGPAHFYRWLKFFHRNADQVQRVARRSDAYYARFTEQSRAWSIHYAKTGSRYCFDAGYGESRWWVKPGKTSRYGPPTSAERYSAVNVQNAETVEVRVFAGSVYRSQILAALGLCHASVEYTRHLTTETILKSDGWSWQSFVTYLADKEQYLALRGEIERLVP